MYLQHAVFQLLPRPKLETQAWNLSLKLFNRMCWLVALTTPMHYQTFNNQQIPVQPENCLQCQKYSPYKVRGESCKFVVQRREMAHQCWPRPFYSQAQQPPCAVTQRVKPTHLPLSHPFCLQSKQSLSPKCIAQYWHKQKKFLISCSNGREGLGTTLTSPFSTLQYGFIV